MSLRSLRAWNPFLSRADRTITVTGATIHHDLMFHVERLHAAAAEGDVDNLLKQRYNFVSQRVHIHIVCENFISGKECCPSF